LIEALPPLSLYVHLPWCVAKCPYCDFNSHKAGDAAPRGRYVEALKRDLASEAAKAHGRRIGTIFLGGGTPSLFDPGEIREILDETRRHLDVDDDAEITMEANPGTVERADPRGYREAGINRLSIGVQSFDPVSLARLGRIHGPDEVFAAHQEAAAAGFDSINLDLMFALPGQSLAMAARDVEQAIGLAPEHISYYQLTLEPNTVFHSRPPEGVPDEDAAFAMQEAGHDLLRAAGYARYEISAFSKPGFACRHNVNYWLFGDYLAVGAGAHGKYTDSSGAIRRYQKPAHPLSYMEAADRGADWGSPGELDADDILFEFMLNALRLSAGFSLACFEERTGLSRDLVRPRLLELRNRGLMREAPGASWQATELGLRFLNDLQAQFLPSREAV
jgi:putative oxygen-independent coproporphyrinogen III oxidase